MSDQQIRTRADGSIDTAYYMQRGRRLRSEAAHGMVAGVRTGMPSPLATATPSPVRTLWFSGFRSLWRWV
jgi:hypothetical protein